MAPISFLWKIKDLCFLNRRIYSMVASLRMSMTCAHPHLRIPTCDASNCWRFEVIYRALAYCLLYSGNALLVYNLGRCSVDAAVDRIFQQFQPHDLANLPSVHDESCVDWTSRHSLHHNCHRLHSHSSGRSLSYLSYSSYSSCLSYLRLLQGC